MDIVIEIYMILQVVILEIIYYKFVYIYFSEVIFRDISFFKKIMFRNIIVVCLFIFVIGKILFYDVLFELSWSCLYIF